MRPTRAWIRKIPAQVAIVLRGAMLALILASCATPKKEPEFNIAGYPPAFRDGFLDGCHSAHHPSTPKKDAGRAKAQPQYALGWQDGKDMCASRKKP